MKGALELVPAPLRIVMGLTEPMKYARQKNKAWKKDVALLLRLVQDMLAHKFQEWQELDVAATVADAEEAAAEEPESEAEELDDDAMQQAFQQID